MAIVVFSQPVFIIFFVIPKKIEARLLCDEGRWWIHQWDRVSNILPSFSESFFNPLEEVQVELT